MKKTLQSPLQDRDMQDLMKNLERRGLINVYHEDGEQVVVITDAGQAMIMAGIEGTDQDTGGQGNG